MRYTYRTSRFRKLPFKIPCCFGNPLLMPATIKRPQLRTCSACKKPGHNAGTCPLKATLSPTSTEPRKKITSPLTKPAPLPVRFFVHHVATESKHSPHVIDLKKQSFNVWDSVEAVSPEAISTDKERLFSHREESLLEYPVATPAPAVQPPATIPVRVESVIPPVVVAAPTPVAPTEKTGIMDKKSFTINIPTVHFGVLSKKMRGAAEIRYAHIKEKAQKRLDAWRAEEQKTPPLSPRVLKAAERTHAEIQKQLLAEKTKSEKIEPKVAIPSAFRTKLTTLRSKIVFPQIFGQNDPWRKRLAGALAALLIISIVPSQAQSYYETLQTTKSTITEKSTAGFLALQESTSALLNANLGEAQDGTVRALENFGSAVTIMDDHQFLQKVVSVIPVLGDEIMSRQQLLTAGQEISLGNTYLIKGVNESLKPGAVNLIDKLNVVVLHVRAALPHYQTARASLEKVNPSDLPLQYQSAFTDFKKIFIAATHDFEQIADLGDTFQDLFGGHGLRRYLLVFQNPAEMRATGGFIGSFAEVEVKDGKITKFTVPPGGSYDVQGQLRAFIEPPTPLLMANKRWEFQDANWFPDFPASAEKLLWFYRHSDRGGVDGIIALNASVLQRLLSIIGPVTDAQRGVTLDASSALSTLQGIVEEGSEKKAHKPKQVLSDFSHIFLNYFSSLAPKDLLPTLINLKEALDQKEIQVYLADATQQQKIAGFGWSGAILPTSAEQDYLMVVNSNILGEKSDAKIKQSISHQAVIDGDGSITDTVTITREHTGTPGEKFYGKPNIDYLRLYVPAGSVLLDAKGFSWPDEKNFRAPDAWTKHDDALTSLEHVVAIDDKTGTRVTEEFGKYAFGNWMVTEPGKISQVQLIYRLPITLSTLAKKSTANQNFLSDLLGPQTSVSTYQLIAQKQSGMHSSFDSTIIFPGAWTPVWKDGESLEVAKNGATIKLPDLEKDSIWSLAMKKI